MKTCVVGPSLFKTWLVSPGGGGKGHVQADQLVCKVLKFAKYCCQDVASSWDVPVNVIDYCIGSVTMLSEFVDFLKDEWKVGFSGITGYMNAIGHMLDYRRSTGLPTDKVHVFVAAEIYLQRVKKFLSRKMRVEWRTVLSLEYLESINCWATLEELQRVIPYHSDRYKQIILNSHDRVHPIAAHKLSFATSFIVVVLFLMVKASRPMTYQYLTVAMVRSIGESGIIDQTTFKTMEKYGFDSLIFSIEVLTLVNGYIEYVRPRLNPVSDYVLVCRNGKQLNKFSDTFGRVVYQEIGKYVNPTRYRQIIEIESAMRLETTDQAALSQDQKHTSHLAKVHYQKLHSRAIAERGQESMNKLRSITANENVIASINNCESQERSSSKVDFVAACTKDQLRDAEKRKHEQIQKHTVRRRKMAFSEQKDNY